LEWLCPIPQQAVRNPITRAYGNRHQTVVFTIGSAILVDGQKRATWMLRMRAIGTALCALVCLLAIACTRSAARSAAVVREEQVQFRNGDVTLSATLFLPAKATNCPAVVLFHGSGPQGRYPDIARWFAGLGMAALTYDKRGVGSSTGDFRTVPFMELSLDGLAGVEWLKTHDGINAKKIGVWGISQGGWLGPLAASQSKDVAFVIAVSGPGVSPGEQMIFYYASELRSEGLSEPAVEEATALRRQVWISLSSGAGLPEAKAAAARARFKPWYSQVKAQRDDLIGSLKRATEQSSNWYRTEMNYDPLIALRGLAVPALFVFGDADQLVPVPRSVELISRTLTASGHRDFKIQVFPGADHAIRVPAADGSTQPAPGYHDTVQAWLAAHKFVTKGVQ
jgi:dienelactone hydrolase